MKKKVPSEQDQRIRPRKDEGNCQAAVTVLVYCRDAQEQASKDVGEYLRFGGFAHHQRNDSFSTHFQH